jgi:hypothetical protein
MIVRLIERPTHGLLRREEWLEQIRLDIVAEASPGIGYRNLDHVVCYPHVRRNQLTVAGASHGLQRIAEQIDQDLLDLNPIGQYQVEA